MGRRPQTGQRPLSTPSTTCRLAASFSRRARSTCGGSAPRGTSNPNPNPNPQHLRRQRAPVGHGVKAELVRPARGLCHTQRDGERRRPRSLASGVPLDRCQVRAWLGRRALSVATCLAVAQGWASGARLAWGGPRLAAVCRRPLGGARACVRMWCQVAVDSGCSLRVRDTQGARGAPADLARRPIGRWPSCLGVESGKSSTSGRPDAGC